MSNLTTTTATDGDLATTTHRLGNYVLEVHTEAGKTTGWNITTLWDDAQIVRIYADNYAPQIATMVQSVAGAKITPDSLIREAIEAKTAETLFTAIIEAL